MHRTSHNLEKYRGTCEKVMERAENRCEVLVDKNGKACTKLSKTRCGQFIPREQVAWVNFLHISTRNGRSENWVLNPTSIIFGCKPHHLEEEQTGIRVQGQEYEEGELTYIPE